MQDPGAKNDTGKPKVHSVLRYFPRALIEVARVNEHGAANHGWNTWDTIEDPLSRYADASVRHELSQAMGNLHDKESGLLEQAHICWNHLARLELMLREKEKS